MNKAVFDTNILVSAFLTRHYSGGVSTRAPLRFVREGRVCLYLSPDIVAELLATLTRHPRTQANYRYTPEMAEQYCSDLLDLAQVIDAPPDTPGAVPRDPDDDKIIACAVAAEVDYLVSRDRDLLSLGSYQGIQIIVPEEFLRVVREQRAVTIFCNRRRRYSTKNPTLRVCTQNGFASQELF